MRGRTSQVERWRRRAARAEGRLQDHHAVGGGRAAGELRVAQQATAELAHPNIEVGIGRPGIHAARRLRLDGIIGAKRGHRRLAPLDAAASRALRIDRGQRELHARIGRQRQERCRRAVHIRIDAPEIAVQHVDLAGDLRIRNILRGRIPHHVHHHRYLRHTGTAGNAAVTLVESGQVFDIGAHVRIRGIFGQQAAMHVHRGAGARLRRTAALPPITAAATTTAAHAATARSAATSHAAAIAHVHATGARHALRCLLHAATRHGAGIRCGGALGERRLVGIRHAQAGPGHGIVAACRASVGPYVALDRHRLHGRHGRHAFRRTGGR